VRLLQPHKVGADHLEIFPGNACIRHILNGRLDVLFVIARAARTDAVFHSNSRRIQAQRRIFAHTPGDSGLAQLIDG
jgi:hypothetical protein